ncbi:MAG: hypothetical protein Q9218_003124 [Villophora microphyllina]
MYTATGNPKTRNGYKRRNHGRSDLRERERKDRFRTRHEKEAEYHYQKRITLDHLNHAQRRYLGKTYPQEYPQWAPKTQARASDRRSASPRCEDSTRHGSPAPRQPLAAHEPENQAAIDEDFIGFVVSEDEDEHDSMNSNGSNASRRTSEQPREVRTAGVNPVPARVPSSPVRPLHAQQPGDAINGRRGVPTHDELERRLISLRPPQAQQPITAIDDPRAVPAPAELLFWQVNVEERFEELCGSLNRQEQTRHMEMQARNAEIDVRFAALEERDLQVARAAGYAINLLRRGV